MSVGFKPDEGLGPEKSKRLGVESTVGPVSRGRTQEISRTSAVSRAISLIKRSAQTRTSMFGPTIAPVSAIGLHLSQPPLLCAI
ncbi:hypothetical protein NL676_004140 [Syzygium grande]|nr:hypothetical protein NL676_004140 [Syzygium grande]